MLNVAALMGRLTANPELKYTQSGLAFTRFTIAVNRNFAKQGEDRQTDFIDIVAWRNTAEFACKYLNKGQLIAVNGSIRTGSYQDKNGVQRKSFEIMADNINFAEPKRDSYDTPQNNGFANQQNRTETEEVNTSFSNGIPSDFEDVISDDDLPF